MDTSLAKGIIWIGLITSIYSLNGQSQLGVFDSNQDIGNVKLQGSSIFFPESGYYTLKGAGVNMWGPEDQFQYLWKAIQGDFIVRARVEFIGPGVDAHRKVGWTVRNSFHTGAAMVNATVHGGDGLTSLQYRAKDNEETIDVKSTDNAPDVIQLERRGNLFIMSTAKFGKEFTSVQTKLDLKNEVYVGLSLCSHNPDVVETAIFKNVRIIKPVPESYVQYEDYIGSRLEVMNVTTGDKKVLLSTAHSIQAPNWTPDGKTLVYNSNGFLFKYELATGKTSMLNSGFATNNNNDHVLSSDGKQIAISHHNDDDNGDSSIYYLPIEGSDNPVKVTGQGLGASYLHGWSPDNKKMVFTGKRNGKYDIFELDVKTGKEKQFTNTPNLDDGSEYSPDGKYIYFNSDRTGTMQVWRMKSNGKDQTQLTFDEHNDWFPHVSPDGKQILMISFPKEVASDDHPFYKHCLLRIMPVDGGNPKIISYIYGGQGTINVPSWSPDSKKVAFVTNSD